MGTMSRPLSRDAQAEGVTLMAETALADARAVCARIGADESDAVTLLIHAAAMGAADLIGPNAGRRRVERAVDIASRQFAEAVPQYLASRTKPIGEPGHG